MPFGFHPKIRDLGPIRMLSSYTLLPPSQIISLSKNLREFIFTFDQNYKEKY